MVCALLCLFDFHVLYETYCGDILNREMKRLMTIARSSATYMQYCLQGVYESNYENIHNATYVTDALGVQAVVDGINVSFALN